MRPAGLAILLAGLTAAVAIEAWAADVTREIDGVHVEVRSVPSTPLTTRKTIYTVRLLDAAAQPVTDARITVTARMKDGMSAVAPLHRTEAPGVYRGEVLFTMEGPWDLTVRVARPGGHLEVAVRERVAR